MLKWWEKDGMLLRARLACHLSHGDRAKSHLTLHTHRWQLLSCSLWSCSMCSVDLWASTHTCSRLCSGWAGTWLCLCVPENKSWNYGSTEARRRQSTVLPVSPNSCAVRPAAQAARDPSYRPLHASSSVMRGWWMGPRFRVLEWKQLG